MHRYETCGRHKCKSQFDTSPHVVLLVGDRRNDAFRWSTAGVQACNEHEAAGRGLTLAPHTMTASLLSSCAPKQSTFMASKMSVQRLLGAPNPVLAAPACTRPCDLHRTPLTPGWSSCTPCRADVVFSQAIRSAQWLEYALSACRQHSSAAIRSPEHSCATPDSPGRFADDLLAAPAQGATCADGRKCHGCATHMTADDRPLAPDRTQEGYRGRVLPCEAPCPPKSVRYAGHPGDTDAVEPESTLK